MWFAIAIFFFGNDNQFHPVLHVFPRFWVYLGTSSVEFAKSFQILYCQVVIYDFFQNFSQIWNFGLNNLFSDMFVICETGGRLVGGIVVAEY